VSRPCIFAVFNVNEVYLPLVDIELLNSVYMSAVLSQARHLVKMRSETICVFLVGTTWHRATRGEFISSR